MFTFKRISTLLVAIMPMALLSQPMSEEMREKLLLQREEILLNKEELLKNREVLLENQEALLRQMAYEAHRAQSFLENFFLLQKKYKITAETEYIYIAADEQKLYLMRGSSIQKEYPVSTAVKGLGNIRDSDKTPRGMHYIREKIGDKENFGTIFIERKSAKKEAEIIEEPKDVEDDYVLSRILWLDGLEDDKNNGGMVDTYNRNIYIHGTHEEGLIGTPASHGCIRMLNKDVIELFKLVEVETMVIIEDDFDIDL